MTIILSVNKDLQHDMDCINCARVCIYMYINICACCNNILC